MITKISILQLSSFVLLQQVNIKWHNYLNKPDLVRNLTEQLFILRGGRQIEKLNIMFWFGKTNGNLFCFSFVIVTFNSKVIPETCRISGISFLVTSLIRS